MIFKKKPPKIVFHTKEAFVAELHPIEPASSYFANTRKRLAKASSEGAKKAHRPVNGSSAHLCSGLRNLLESCWVLRAPTDIAITTNGDGRSVEWEVPLVLDTSDNSVQFFEPHQWAEIVPKFKLDTLKTLVKIHTGWSVDLPKNHSLMFLPVDIFGEENRFTPFSGPLQGGKAPVSLNPVLYWHIKDGAEIIKAGTPLCLLRLVRDDICDTKKDLKIIVNDAEHIRRLVNSCRAIASVFGPARHVIYDTLIAGKDRDKGK